MEIKNQNQPDNHIDYFAPKILWTIIGVLLLVVVGASYLWWQEIKKSDNSNQQTVNSKQETQNSIADWKTYTNTEYGYEFKYPKDHTAYASAFEETLTPAESDAKLVALADDEKLLFCCEAQIFKVTVYTDPNVTIESVLSIIPDKKEVEIHENFNFQGNNGVEVIGCGCLSSPYKTIAVKKDNNIILIVQDAKTELLDDVFSSFKFIESVKPSGSAMSRDRQRYADILAWRVSLELYFHDHDYFYPTTLAEAKTYFNPNSDHLRLAPPLPAGGACTEQQNVYNYKPSADKLSYTLTFCFEERFDAKASSFNTSDVLTAGPHIVDPSGIK